MSDSNGLVQRLWNCAAAAKACSGRTEFAQIAESLGSSGAGGGAGG